MAKNKFITAFRLNSKLLTEKLKVQRLIYKAKSDDDALVSKLVKRADDLQRRYETVQNYLKTI
jgi:hypothetical protein